MIKLFLAAFAACSLFALAAQTGFADGPCGARWYPFYGYHQPAYLAPPVAVTVQPVIITAQPNGAQAYTTGYWPSETTVAPSPGSYYSQPYYSQPATSGRFYPFYGYRRPAYLDH